MPTTREVMGVLIDVIVDSTFIASKGLLSRNVIARLNARTRERQASFIPSTSASPVN
jgi:hypothetical protein